MIGLIQRVSEAEIWVNGEKISSIGKGIFLLTGVAKDDGPVTLIIDSRAGVNGTD